jgi:WhiB family transcriptional regulator, redox-sensing transcriptional regulator
VRSLRVMLSRGSKLGATSARMLAVTYDGVPVVSPVEGLEYGSDVSRLARAWMNDALCIDCAEVEFFPVRGESSLPAKAVCSTCQVRFECLAYALDHEIVQGVWGGLNGRERRALRMIAGQRPFRR